jgi:hypothetical protein
MSSGFQCPSVYRQTRYTAKLPSTDCTEGGALTREHSSLIFVPHATDFLCLRSYDLICESHCHFHKIPFDSKYLHQSFFLSEDPI